MIKTILSAVAGLAIFISAGSTIANQEYVIKYSHLGVPDAMMQSSSAKAVVFKAQLEKLSGGRIKVDIYASGRLAGLQSSVVQVRKGTIEIADISSGVLASLYYPPLEILDLPYLFSSRATARMALDNGQPVIRKLIDDCARRTGVRILSLGPFGFRHMTNNIRPIRTPEDMKGLKMRTMEIVPHMKLMESLGATPVPIGWLELYTSLQTNVVDGEETTLQNIVMGKLYQVQKHLTLTGHLMGVGAFLCNEKWYQSLPQDLREALIEAEMTARLTYDGFGELLDTLALEELSDKMQIYSPTAEQMKMFREAARPYVTNWMREQPWGQEESYRGLVGEFLASIEAVEERLAEQAKSAETAHK